MSKTNSVMQTILLIDDDFSELQNYFTYLSQIKSDFQLITGTDSAQALGLAKHLKPDLIITKWEMPPVSGKNIVELLTRPNLDIDIPILVIVDESTPYSSIRHDFGIAPVDFIRKSFLKEDLKRRINYMLNLGKVFQNSNKNRTENSLRKKAIIEKQERVLSSKMLEIQQKDELLRIIKNKLSEIMINTEGIMHSKINSLLNSIKISGSGKSNWSNFQFHFENVHPQFFTTLQCEYPVLTMEDLRYCSFIMMQMSTTEIAQLLHITRDTVITRKYRIKKKMGLAKDSNLRSYLASVVTPEFREYQEAI